MIEEKNELKKVQVLFLPNGNTAVYSNHEQITELQKSWLLKFVEFLEENNVDVVNSTYELPDFNSGTFLKAKLFKTKEGYNWDIER